VWATPPGLYPVLEDWSLPRKKQSLRSSPSAPTLGQRFVSFRFCFHGARDWFSVPTIKGTTKERRDTPSGGPPNGGSYSATGVTELKYDIPD